MGFIKSRLKSITLESYLIKVANREFQLKSFTPEIEKGIKTLLLKGVCKELEVLAEGIIDIGFDKAIDKATLPIVKSYGKFLLDTNKDGINVELIDFLATNQLNVKRDDDIDYVLKVVNKFYDLSKVSSKVDTSTEDAEMSNKQFVDFLAGNDRSVNFIVNFIYDRLPPSKQKDDKNKSVVDYLQED